MFETYIALFYGTAGGILYGVLADETKLRAHVRILLGAVGGLGILLLALKMQQITLGEGFSLAEVLILTAGCLSGGAVLTASICKLVRANQ